MKLLRRLKTFITRRRVDDDIQRELAFHLEMESSERERRGMLPAEARRAAAIDFGGVDAAREHVRDARGLTFIETLIQDIRFGFRLLRRQPTFSVVAVLVLALGIGANTAIFSLVNVLLLKPRPWHVTGEVVGVYSKDTSTPDDYRAFSYPELTDLQSRHEVFASIAGHNFALVGVSQGEATRRVLADVVTANFFDTFGAPPMIGRGFTEAEARPGAEIAVAVLSYAAWQRIGGDPDIVHRTIRINTRDFQIVGVAGRGFGGSIAFLTPELWLPTGVYDTITNDFFREGLKTNLADRNHRNLVVVARLRDGLTSAAAVPALDAITRQMATAFPADNAHQSLVLAPLARMSVSTAPTNDDVLTTLTVALLAMAAVVLFVASFNLANMLLSRGRARRKEFAVRLALGGSRRRLVRQLLTEGFVLSLLGGAAGLVLASLSMRLLVAALSPLSPLSLSFEATPDWTIFAATLGYCSLSTIVFGLLPAWRLARTDAVPELKDAAGEIPAGRRGRLSLPNLLVMGQLGLSLVLVTVAGLFMRGATQAAAADPGFSLDRGIVMQIDPSLAGRDAARSHQIQQDVMARLRARPDVASASLATILPFAEFEDDKDVQLPGAALKAGEAGSEGKLIRSTFNAVGSQYFDTLGLRVLAGREFTPEEERSAGGPRIAIIDEPLRTRLFAEQNPVGQLVQYSDRDPAQAPVVLRIVGVVPGLRDNLFDQEPRPHLYVPFGQEARTGAVLHVRTRATTAAAEAGMLPALRRTVIEVDSQLPILSIETLPMFRDRNLMLAIVRIGAVIFSVFGAVALFLAAVGVYGVKAYLVSRRTREIGIRMALGASPAGVVWMVIRDGLVPSAIGLGLGLGLAAIVGQGMRAMTYQGRAADAAMLGLALAVLTTAALVASWIPARRATRITPTRALRE